MTKEEYNILYNRKFVGLTKKEEADLINILKKIEFSDEEKRILDAFYIPNNKEKFTSPEIITPSQMKAELRNIFVLLKYNYSGYDYFNRNKELDQVHENLIAELDLCNEPIKTQCFFELIMNELHTVIKDNHFSLECNDYRLNTSINKAPYFSDLIIEQKGKINIVINENKYFPKGYIIKEDISKYMFETLSDNENKAFLLGIFQDMKNPVMNIMIDNVLLPLHLSKSANFRISQKNELQQFDKYNMIILKKCHVNDEFSFDKYYEWGEALKKGDCAVISVIDNPGGSSNVCSQIIKGLNGNGVWNVDCSTINLYQKTGIPYKYYTYGRNFNHEGNTYDKTLYVLMNKYTASSGESLVSISNNVKKVIKVGTNTMGCGCFGDIISYVLPQTHATMNIPYKAFYMDDFVEGNGFMPDFWMDDDDMIKTFINWLNKKNHQ